MSSPIERMIDAAVKPVAWANVCACSKPRHDGKCDYWDIQEEFQTWEGPDEAFELYQEEYRCMHCKKADCLWTCLEESE